MYKITNNCKGNSPGFSIVQTNGNNKVFLCVDRMHGYDIKIFSAGMEMTIPMAELETLFEQYKKALKEAK